MSLATKAAFATAHWTLDEASGTRASTIGSNDLTDNNTVGSGTGKFSDAANFIRANSESLSRADSGTGDLAVGDFDWMLRCWFKITSQHNEQCLSARDGISGQGNGSFYWNFITGGSTFLQFFVASTSGFGGTTLVQAANFGPLSLDTWYLGHAWHDATNNQIGVAVNGVANTASHSAGIFQNTGAGTRFWLGGSGYGWLNFNGMIDDFVFLKNGLLDSTEMVEDYNSGTGVAFADWAGGGGGFIDNTAPVLMHVLAG